MLGAVPEAPPPHRPSRRRDAAWLALAAALHLLPFATRPVLIGGDEPHYALMAHSLAVDHDVALADDYAAVAAGSNAAGKRRAGQRLEPHLRPEGDGETFTHPLGLPALAAPLLAALHAVAPDAAPDLALGLGGSALCFAAFLAGWRLLARRLDEPGAAAIVAVAAYFGSPLWYSSRTFFTEPYTWAFAVLAVAAVAARRGVAAAVFLGLALAMKETALVLVVAIVGAVAVRRGAAAAARLLAGPAAVLVLLAVKNLVLYGRAIVPFQPYRLGDPAAGLLGLLFGGEKGLLFFAPVLLVGAAGFFVPRRGDGVERGAAAAIVLGYLAAVACWIDWRGGASYGPRLLVPALPALAVPLAALWEAHGRRRGVRAVVAGTFVVGFTVQWCAALDPVRAFWATDVATIVLERPASAVSGVVVGALLWIALRRWPPRWPLTGNAG